MTPQETALLEESAMHNDTAMHSDTAWHEGPNPPRDSNTTTMVLHHQKAFDGGVSRTAGIREGVLDAIGNTPLIRLHRYLDEPTVRLFVKWEAANPGGSAKDRPAKHMVETALADGRLQPGGTVVESSSGNMAIGLAQACRYYGLRFVAVVDPNVQESNVRIVRALGGEVRRVTEPHGGSYLNARIALVQEIVRETPDAFWTNQYANPANPQSHWQGTADEIADAPGRQS